MDIRFYIYSLTNAARNKGKFKRGNQNLRSLNKKWIESIGELN